MIPINNRLLIIEDDPQIRHFMEYFLTEKGFQCQVADTAQEGLSIFVTQAIDLIILDLGLPDYDGAEVIQKVREWSQAPIIVVSARDQECEKIKALDLGADDYLTKPFSSSELLARIKVSLRHLSQMNNERAPIFSVGDLILDIDRRQARLAQEDVHLTPLEFQLLAYLFKNQGKVVTHQQLLKELYGYEYGTDTQALRALLAGLRRKIEENPAKPRYIKTEIGVGYRLTDQ